MKTGGTMNFLKRAGAILMVVAIFASSCNKYDDDFEQINNKLDLLAGTVQGVTTLNADLTALKTQVTALQTAVAALPAAQTAQLKVETDKILLQISAITTTLATVATAGNASKLVIDQLKLDLAALTLKATNDNAAMTIKLNGLGTSDVAQTAQLDALITANADLLTKIAAIQADMDAAAQTGATGDALTALTIGGLQAMLNAQKIQLDIIMANTAMYNGDVTITTPAELEFYLAKITQLGIINGNLTVKTAGFDATQMVNVNKITSAITAVIGTTGNVYLGTTSVAVLNLSALTSVKGFYKVVGVDVSDDALSSVGGSVTFNYDGPYTSTALKSVGTPLMVDSLVLVNKAAAAPLVGTTLVSFPNVKVDGGVYDAVAGTAGVLVFPLATSVEISGGVKDLSAAIATTVKIGTAVYPTGLKINAPLATTVDLSAATTVTLGILDITAAATAVVNLDNFATTTGAPINVTISGPTTISLPKYVAGSLTSDATMVTLAKHEWGTPATIAAVKWLTLGNVNATVNLNTWSATLLTANISGKAQTTWALTTGAVATTGNAVLTTLTLGGNLRSATLTTLPLLTSLTTTGVVNSLTLNSAAIITSLSLGHGHYVGGPGSDLVITNNAKLTSVVSSTDMMKSLDISSNGLLVSLNLSSYVNILNPTSTVSINIGANKLTGVYTAPVAGTATTNLVEGTVVSADLATLSAYVAKLAVPAANITLTITADLYDSNGAAAGTTALSTAMDDGIPSYSNVFGTSKVDATGGINSAAEYTLVAAQ